jgi:hypothetical protein
MRTSNSQDFPCIHDTPQLFFPHIPHMAPLTQACMHSKAWISEFEFGSVTLLFVFYWQWRLEAMPTGHTRWTVPCGKSSMELLLCQNGPIVPIQVPQLCVSNPHSEKLICYTQTAPGLRPTHEMQPKHSMLLQTTCTRTFATLTVGALEIHPKTARLVHLKDIMTCTYLLCHALSDASKCACRYTLIASHLRRTRVGTPGSTKMFSTFSRGNSDCSPDGRVWGRSSLTPSGMRAIFKWLSRTYTQGYGSGKGVLKGLGDEFIWSSHTLTSIHISVGDLGTRERRIASMQCVLPPREETQLFVFRRLTTEKGPSRACVP